MYVYVCLCEFRFDTFGRCLWKPEDISPLMLEFRVSSNHLM